MALASGHLRHIDARKCPFSDVVQALAQDVNAASSISSLTCGTFLDRMSIGEIQSFLTLCRSLKHLKIGVVVGPQAAVSPAIIPLPEQTLPALQALSCGISLLSFFRYQTSITGLSLADIDHSIPVPFRLPELIAAIEINRAVFARISSLLLDLGQLVPTRDVWTLLKSSCSLLQSLTVRRTKVDLSRDLLLGLEEIGQTGVAPSLKQVEFCASAPWGTDLNAWSLDAIDTISSMVRSAKLDGTVHRLLRLRTRLRISSSEQRVVCCDVATPDAYAL
jgi:hypothetical protein